MCWLKISQTRSHLPVYRKKIPGLGFSKTYINFMNAQVQEEGSESNSDTARNISTSTDRNKNPNKLYLLNTTNTIF